MSFSIFATSEIALAVCEKPLDTKICSEGLRGKLLCTREFCRFCLNAYAQGVQCGWQVLSLKLARGFCNVSASLLIAFELFVLTPTCFSGALCFHSVTSALQVGRMAFALSRVFHCLLSLLSLSDIAGCLRMIN